MLPIFPRQRVCIGEPRACIGLLDVTFGDDQNQTRLSAAAQNLAIVRRMVFNTLKQETKVRPKLSKPKKTHTGFGR